MDREDATRFLHAHVRLCGWLNDISKYGIYNGEATININGIE